MKNKRLLFAALFAAVMGMVACENENDLPQLPDGTDIPETYTVSLACGGELGMDVTYDPMSRTDADSNDLYGVQVMYTNESGVTKPYAYGLFDDPSKMTLTLLSKHSYSFQVLLVKDGKNTIYSDSITIDGVKNYLGYGLPFTNHDGTQQISTALTNKFNISEKVRLQSNSNIYVERIYAGTVQFQKNGSSTLYADCLTKKLTTIMEKTLLPRPKITLLLQCI